MKCPPQASIAFPTWSESFREFFDLAPADWTPPEHIKSTLNAARDRLVLEGRFWRPDGTRVKLKTFLRREGEDWFVIERKLDVRLTWKPEVVQ